MIHLSRDFIFFFFNDTATTEIYTLSLHDALPISISCPCCGPGSRSSFPATGASSSGCCGRTAPTGRNRWEQAMESWTTTRSEEHTSELQSPCNLVCRLLLEKKKPKPRYRQGRGM